MTGLSSVYPPPPSYYKHFTTANIQKLAAWRQGQTSEQMNILSDMMSDSFHKLDEPAAPSPSKSKPGDEGPEHPLEFLIPPKPPADGTYRSFGNIWQPDDKLVPLSAMGIKQLYNLGGSGDTTKADGDTETEVAVAAKKDAVPNIQDRIFELKKLLNSLLVQFVELAGIMSISPESFPEKTEDIRVILINIHHLLNEYRPHQSRESLILLMEDELATKRKDIEDLKKTNEGIRDKIADLANQFRVLLPACQGAVKEEKGQDQTSVQANPPNVDLLQWQLLDSSS